MQDATTTGSRAFFHGKNCAKHFLTSRFSPHWLAASVRCISAPHMETVFPWLERLFLARPWCLLAWPAVAMILGTLLRLVGGAATHSLAILPRQPASLPAILTAPFLHANLAHLGANLPPFLVLGYLVMRRGDLVFAEVAGGTALGGELLVWLLARSAAHMGMSGVIFGLLGYLLAIAGLHQTTEDLLIAAGVLLFYGGMLGGIAPARDGVSWESHLFGLLVGGGLAWLV